MSTSLTISQDGSGPQVNGVAIAHVAALNLPVGRAELSPVAVAAGQDPTSIIGYGGCCELVKQACSQGANAVVVSTAKSTQIPGTIGSITHTGGGPTVTASLTDGSTWSGPFQGCSFVLSCILGGALGVAQFAVALDGQLDPSAAPYSYVLPPQLAAAAAGLVDLTTVADFSTLNTLTLICKADADGSNVTVTFTGLTSGSKPADVVAFITAAAGFGTHNAAALVSGKYLQISSKVLGSTSTQLIGAGTANTILGLTAGTVTGAASKIAIPGTNVSLTFASGTYVKGDVYAFTTTGPKASLADLLTALDALKANFASTPFAKIQIDQDPVDAAEALAWEQAFATKVLGWRNATPRVFATVIMSAPYNTAANAYNPKSSGFDESIELAVRSAFGTTTENVCLVCVGDAYCAGQNLIGNFHRSARGAVGLMLATHSLSEDPGNATFGAIPGWSLTGPNGEIARNEDLMGVKMGTSTGPGFTCLKLKSDGPYVVRGVTRAGPTSRFVDIGVLSMALYSAAIVDQDLHSIENTTYDLNPDGTMRAIDAHALGKTFTQHIVDGVVSQNHASAAVCVIDNSKSMVSGPAAREVIANWQCQIRGQAEFIVGSLSISGTLTLS